MMPSLSTADHRAVARRSSRSRATTTPRTTSSSATSRPGARRRSPTSTTTDAYTYGELAERVNRCANALVGLGLQPEQRVLAVPARHASTSRRCSSAAIKAGIVPVAGNTLLDDERLRLHAARQPRPGARRVGAAAARVRAAPRHAAASRSRHRLGRRPMPTRPAPLARASCWRRPRRAFAAADTTRDDACFWLYSSGSTGAPKGTVHVHSSLIETAELYAKPILGIREDDVVFSAAKLFFAYGLGNGLTFPLAVGATTVLMAERPTPQAVFARLAQAPADDLLRRADALRRAAREPRSARRAASCGCASARRPARRCRPTSASAGPSTSASRSSTASARPRCCTSSCPTARATCATARAACRCRATSCASSATTGSRCRRARSASCRSTGPTAAIGYWNNREKSRATFQGAVDAQRRQVLDRRRRLLRLFRPQRRHAEGRRHLRVADRGRVGAGHAPAVLEAAVIGREDEEQLVKPVAYVVLQGPRQGRRRARRRAAAAREGAARALQVSALDRVHRRAAEDGNG